MCITNVSKLSLHKNVYFSTLSDFFCAKSKTIQTKNARVPSGPAPPLKIVGSKIGVRMKKTRSWTTLYNVFMAEQSPAKRTVRAKVPNLIISNKDKKGTNVTTFYIN